MLKTFLWSDQPRALLEVKNVGTPLGQLNKTEILWKKKMCQLNFNVPGAIFDFAKEVFSILGDKSLGLQIMYQNACKLSFWKSVNYVSHPQGIFKQIAFLWRRQEHIKEMLTVLISG